jgi:hypothetical protein
VTLSEQLVRLSRQRPLPVTALQEGQRVLQEERRHVLALGTASPAIGPLLVALLREVSNDDVPGLVAQAQYHAKAYRSLQARLQEVRDRLAVYRAVRPNKELHVLHAVRSS